MTGAVLDLHCHTVQGSVDSQLTLAQLVERVRSSGLTGCCISEHNVMWERHTAERFELESALPFIRGMEVSTNLGHILVYGLDRYLAGINDAWALRQAVGEAGGFMIAAHPFRGRFRQGARLPHPAHKTIEASASLELFGLVDDIEVLNGGTGPLENYLALHVARHLGFRGIAGSDAHSTHGLGRYATVFEGPVASTADLVSQLRQGRYAAVELHEGAQIPFGAADDAALDERLNVALTAHR